MKTILNILWVVLVGFWTAVGWAIAGVILTILIVTAPFGRQCFKMANFTLWPFGREAIDSPTGSSLSPLGNLIWIILAGLWLAIAYIIGGILQCITIIGIPFGVQSFKLAGLAFAPFGKEIVKRKDLQVGL